MVLKYIYIYSSSDLIFNRSNTSENQAVPGKLALPVECKQEAAKRLSRNAYYVNTQQNKSETKCGVSVFLLNCRIFLSISFRHTEQCLTYMNPFKGFLLGKQV